MTTPEPSSNGAPHIQIYVVLVELDTGEQYTARIDGRDRRTYARHRVAHELPAFEGKDTPDDLMEVIVTGWAWCALVRTGEIDTSWPVFDAHCIGVQHQDEVPVPPTVPATAG